MASEKFRQSEELELLSESTSSRNTKGKFDDIITLKAQNLDSLTCIFHTTQRETLPECSRRFW
jgi:hypothetical protein